MFKRKYTYFISFWNVMSNNSFGFGNAEVVVDHKIKTASQIRDVEKELSEKHGCIKCITVSIQLLGRKWCRRRKQDECK